MSSTVPGRRGPLAVSCAIAKPTAEIVLQVVFVGAVTGLVELLQGRETPERAFVALAFAGGVAATILVAVGAWMSGGRRGRLIAASVGLYTCVALVHRVVDTGDGGVPGSVAASIAAAVGGAVALVAGVRRGCPLQRRAGTAFVTAGAAVPLGVATGSAQLVGVLELGATAMLLAAAFASLLTSVRAVGLQQELSRSRVAEAEAVVASVAERDHELRNVVAGLSGAARVLADEGIGDSPDGRRLLVAASAELARLQTMLGGHRVEAWPAAVAVEPVLRDLALVHRSTGLDLDVDVQGDPTVAIGRDELAQVVTNLLVNCARHAPGARVHLRVHPGGAGMVRVEVADDGPGLPRGPVERLRQRGVRGPGSNGDGVGLAIAADLVEGVGGTFRLTSPGRGCTAVIEIPAVSEASELAVA